MILTRQKRHQNTMQKAIIFVYKAGDITTSSSANQNGALVIAH